MKLIIAGSRSFGRHDADERQMSLALEPFVGRVTEVVSGGALGADMSGESWAVSHKIPIKRFLPDWKWLGKKAGPIRNAAMADYADEAVVFWDGSSGGTANMIEQMKRRNKPCTVSVIHARLLAEDRP